jgi:pSer/pThr/pTyr-binding forkhead associated (FHA) protein
MGREIILQELSSGEKYTVTLPCILGRGNEADLSLPDMSISHKHALIAETDDSRIWIEDLKSANGVYVADKKIRNKAVLKTGDSFQLGNTKFLISESEEDISRQTVILHSLQPTEKRSLDHERLKVIYEITDEFASSRDIGDLGERIFLRFKEIFRQDRGYIASFQEDGTLKPICLCSGDETVPVSRSIIDRLLQNGESFILEDALSDDAFSAKESIMALKVRSALCVPLIYHSQIYGLIYLDRNVPGAYSQEDLQFLRSIGFILAPLIENARLWSEHKNRYANTVETLKATEEKLIETERTAAFVRLAHAMAHEIRNPMMVIGGLVRKMARTESSGNNDSFSAIMMSVNRVEKVLKEVDGFVRIPPPVKALHRIDRLVQEEIDAHNEEWLKKSVRPSLSVTTPHVMVPVDAVLIRKAVSMVLREIIFALPDGAALNVSITNSGNDIDITFGEADRDARLSEPFDPELNHRPWSTSLFLNMAHKILIDHGGRLLMDPKALSVLPVIMRIPVTEKM